MQIFIPNFNGSYNENRVLYNADERKVNVSYFLFYYIFSIFVSKIYMVINFKYHFLNDKRILCKIIFTKKSFTDNSVYY